jgi:putative transposase
MYVGEDQLFTNLHAHLVFTPKYRRGPLTSAILDRCEEIMAEVCTDFGAELHEFNGETDHVHLMTSARPTTWCRNASASSR